jgi:hypothetical protein
VVRTFITWTLYKGTYVHYVYTVQRYVRSLRVHCTQVRTFITCTLDKCTYVHYVYTWQRYVRSLRGHRTKNRMCSGKFTALPSILPIAVAARSKAARLLESRFRIPPTARMSVSCDCFVLGQSLCDGLIARPGEPYRLWCIWMWSRSLDNEEAQAD